VSTDNLGASEVHELSVTNLVGFAEGASVTHTLVMGNLLSNDASTLYLGTNAVFNPNLPITVVAFVSTRLGSVVAFKEVTKSA
jgi:predicted membrane protein